MDIFTSANPYTPLREDASKPWIFLDMDDTVLGIEVAGKIELNERAYTSVLERFAQELSKAFPKVTEKQVLDLQFDIDVALCKEYGFEDPNRFAHSLLETFEVLRDQYGKTYDDELYRYACHVMGRSVFNHKFVPLPWAVSTMATLEQWYNIAIVTKGNRTLQLKKAIDSGVIMYCHRFFSVGFKDETDWNDVFLDLSLTSVDLAKCWAIGNSAKADVNVPLSFGTNGIHVLTGGWGFEKAALGTPLIGRTVTQVNEISEVLNILQPTLVNQ